MDQLADGIVDRHETFGVELAQRYMERPLSGCERAQAIEGEIDTFADADAGVADEQKSVAGDIVAAQELLLDEAILFRSQWTRKPGIGLRPVIGMEETDQAGSSWSHANSSSKRRSARTCRERVLLTKG